MIDTDKYEGLTIDDWYKMNHHDWKYVVNEHNDLLAEVKRLRQEIKDYDACLQNLWDNELIPDDTDIWDEVKELLEVD